MTCTLVAPLSALIPSEQPSTQTLGNILYVGGSGPGNYTKIQDAINTANDGDTIFVYDDSSPYYENLEVNKSIMIQGEEIQTTIIDGTNRSDGITITADDVTITGFTIQNCWRTDTLVTSGIVLSSNNNTIKENRLIQCAYGVSNVKSFDIPPRKGHNMITRNDISHCDWAVFFVNASDITISHNLITQSEEAINLLGVKDTNISYNLITDNDGGILILESTTTTIYRNNISYNTIGIGTIVTSNDNILQNNFIGNTKHHAMTSQILVQKIIAIKFYLQVPLHRNIWNENYWDGPRSTPYIIFGVFKLRFSIDWHPAQTPYEIEG